MEEVTAVLERAARHLSVPTPLCVEHDLSRFDCGQPQINDWLIGRAIKNESRFSRTYVVGEGHRVVAYYCIAAGSVDRVAVPSRVRRNAPDAIPVSVIGRLAVTREHAGKGLGSDMLADALRRVAVASRSIGIGAILVHATDAAAKRFYMNRAEFIEYPPDGQILFLPVETIVATLS